MLDIGWTEMLAIAVIALIIIGPKDLPRALRAVSKYVRKARSLAREFQSGLDDIARETELHDIKRQVDDLTRPDIKGEFDRSIDPTGGFSDAMNLEKDLPRLEETTGEASDAKKAAPTPPTPPTESTETASDEVHTVEPETPVEEATEGVRKASA